MAYRGMKVATAIGAAALFAALLGPASWAAEPATDAAPQKVGGQSFEVDDAPDSPPLNYRSNEDERYDTPGQRNAEMSAEQYEKERQERQLREQKLLDSLPRSPAGGGRLNDNVGRSDEGFPSRPAY